jgi:hypothetical protein
MIANEYNDNSEWRQALVGAIESLATRPQKNVVDTTTTTVNTPYALANMIASRDKIGEARQNLDEMLKMREGVGYNIFNSLAGIPQREGYGGWLSDFARAFGGGAKGISDAKIARAEKRYENEMKDLETILKFDKEMGGTQTQSQHQTIGYDNLPFGGGKQNGTGDGGVIDYTLLPTIKLHDLNTAAGRWATNKYDPSDKDQGFWDRMGIMALNDRDYGVDKSRGTEQAKAYEKYETMAMQGMFDVLKYLRPATDTDVLTALKSAGADPTMYPDVRDMRLTKELNKELVKGGHNTVDNLQHWDQSLELLRTTGIWNPKLAKQLFGGQNMQEQPAQQQGVLTGEIYTTKDGRQFRRKN